MGVQWKRAVFIDTCLPLGLRSAPKLFNTLADLLAWIMEQHGAQPLLHYLDNFLKCQRVLQQWRGGIYPQRIMQGFASNAPPTHLNVFHSLL